MRSLERRIAADPALAALVSDVAPRLADDPGHDLSHALRVAAWTLRIGGPEIEPRLALAAALLHDVVNLPKDSPDRARASALSADVAREVLCEHGFSTTEVDQVADAIVDHSFSRGAVPRSLLGRALQDADRLEALGALGLMRCISCGTQMGARYFDSDDPWAERRELDDRRYCIDHFQTKLLGLPRAMTTEVGRCEAERRAVFLRVFLEQLRSEIDSG